MKFGIIGAGGYAKYRILPSFGCTERATVASVQRRDSKACKELASAFSVKHHCSSVDELLKQKLDAVWVTSPNNLHKHHSLQAIAAGCHVLIEKPAALNQAEVGEICAAAKKAGVFAGVGYCCRYSPNVVAAKKLVSSLGTIVHVGGVLSLNRRETPVGPRYQSWMLDDEVNGTGVLFDLGCHALDLLMHLTGDDWSVGHAHKTEFVPERQKKELRIADTATLHLSGDSAQRSASIFVSHRSSRYSEFKIVGTKSTLVLGFPFGKDALQSLTHISESQVPMTRYFADAEIQRDFLEAFVDACAGQIGSFPTIEESLAVQCWMDQTLEKYNAS